MREGRREGLSQRESVCVRGREILREGGERKRKKVENEGSSIILVYTGAKVIIIVWVTRTTLISVYPRE